MDTVVSVLDYFMAVVFTTGKGDHFGQEKPGANFNDVYEATKVCLVKEGIIQLTRDCQKLTEISRFKGISDLVMAEGVTELIIDLFLLAHEAV